MKMTTAVFLATLLPSAAYPSDEALQSNIKEGAEVIKAFFGDLKGELEKGMRELGPVGSIDMCSKAAPRLARDHSRMSGWQVGRTSLKPRNPHNTPDAWETAVLNEFERRKAAGENPMKLVKAAVVEEEGHQVFRMMKAIPTAEVCTQCHGESIAAPVSAKLDERYPTDRARGFKVGDLRGAFTLKKPLLQSAQ